MLANRNQPGQAIYKKGSHVPAIALIAVAILLIQCSTTRVSRDFGSEGKLKQVKVFHRDNPVSRYELSYDKKSRLTRIDHYTGKGDESDAIHRFYYDRANRLKLHWYKGEHSIGGKQVQDEWVESFIFNRAGNLIRTEISYKKPYSIKQSQTPLLKTSYQYRQNLLEEIILDGGRYAFTKRAVLNYDDDSLEAIEYTRKTYRWKEKKEILTRHITFYMDGIEPYKYRNRMTGETTGNDDLVEKEFMAEGIWMALQTPDYAADPDKYINVLIAQYR